MSFNIQIPNEIIRNKEINAMEFTLLGKLIQAFYLSGKKDEFELAHKNLIYLLSIGDNNTFKKAYNNLHKQGYVLNKVVSLPRKGGITVWMNKRIIPEFNKKAVFTQLTKDVLDKSVIDSVGYVGVRMIYYFQSHINKKDRRNYCFASEETIANDLGITKKTVVSYNNKLKSANLVKIDAHELKDTGEYQIKGGKEILIFKKYNNHYFVNEEQIEEFVSKRKVNIML